MKVAIVNCFDTYMNRVKLIRSFFESRGYEVMIIQSNFSHFDKHYLTNKEDNITYIETAPYKKNLSLERLASHQKFSKEAIKKVEEIKPDLLYTLIPPNSLAKFAAAYKKRHKEVKLIFDLIDLWPETMPIPIDNKVFPLSLWGGKRDKHLRYADLVITECNLYKDVLFKPLDSLKVETLYLAKEESELISKPLLNETEFHISYLGSINNIIDIPRITEILTKIKSIKPVTLHIVGDGEKKKDFIQTVERCGISVIDHGKIFDLQEKQRIFDGCHFGLNIMKESVCVGLTMKSIDYFQHGLPIINNIPSDTAKLVDKYGIGINILNSEDIVKNINHDNLNKISQNRKVVFDVFQSKFSVKAFNKRMEEIFSDI